MWPFAKKLYHSWISTMMSSNEISWTCPTEMKSWLRPWWTCNYVVRYFSTWDGRDEKEGSSVVFTKRARRAFVFWKQQFEKRRHGKTTPGRFVGDCATLPLPGSTADKHTHLLIVKRGPVVLSKAWRGRLRCTFFLPGKAWFDLISCWRSCWANWSRRLLLRSSRRGRRRFRWFR